MTLCQAVGDFVAEIRFTLSTWPAGDNVGLALTAPNLGNTFVDSEVGGDTYGLFITAGRGADPHLGAAAASCVLSRRGSLASAYARSGLAGSWQQIGRLNASTSSHLGRHGDLEHPRSRRSGASRSRLQVESFKLDAEGLSC